MAHAEVLDRETFDHTVVELLVGAGRMPSAVPFPNCPAPLLPQQLGDSNRGGAGGSARTGSGLNKDPATPHTACSPTETVVQARELATAVGVVLLVVELSPSWPYTLLPQQNRSPLALVAHEAAVPRDTMDQSVAALTSAGTKGVALLPSPIWPLLFKPCSADYTRVSRRRTRRHLPCALSHTPWRSPSTTAALLCECHTCGDPRWTLLPTSRRNGPVSGSACWTWSRHQPGHLHCSPAHRDGWKAIGPGNAHQKHMANPALPLGLRDCAMGATYPAQKAIVVSQ